MNKQFLNFNHFLAGLLMVLTLSLSHLNAEGPPNVIMIALDDLNDWIGPMGNTQAKTPNMDRLAKRGITFQNAHTVGIFCAPSRAALFTGRLPSTTGIYEETPTAYQVPQDRPLQVAFSEAGYATYGTGKLYHHREGFLDLRGWTDYFMQTEEQKFNGWAIDTWKFPGCPFPDPFPHNPLNQKGKPNGGLFMEQGPLKNEEEPKMADTMRTQWVVDLLGKKQEKPFFIGVGYYVPHFPNYVPQKYFDLYDKSKIVRPPYKEEDLEDLPPAIKERQLKRKAQWQDKLVENGLWDEAIVGYLAATSYGDAMIGRILDALDKSPYRDNTIIVLWSDNGFHLGEKGHWGKHTLWQRTTNVPMMWAGPGLAKGAKITASSSLIDIYPSLVDLCKLSPDPGFDGKSLAKALRDPSKAQDHEIFTVAAEGEYSSVNTQWRYIHYRDGTEELYDVKADPNEWSNLANNPEYQKIKEQMKVGAPSKFQKSGKTPNDLVLLCEGKTFHWEEKKPNSPPSKYRQND